MFLFSFLAQLKDKRFPCAGLALAAIGGILFEELLCWPSLWLLVVAFVTSVFMLWSLYVSTRVSQLFLMLMIAASFGAVHAWQWQESPAQRLAAIFKKESGALLVEGVVASDVKVSQHGCSSFFIKVRQLVLNSGTISNPDVTMMVHWEGDALSYGDLVRFRAVAKPPSAPRNPGEFNAASWLARQEVTTELIIDPSDPGNIISSGHGLFFMRWAIASRHWAEQMLQLGIASDAPIIAAIKGIVLGTKTEESFFDDFKLTGTVHLFAVSGLHVGMVAMMIWFFLKLLRVPRSAAVLTMLLLLFFYVMMTGDRIGSLRAVMMSSIVLGGLLFYRQPQMINSLAAAAFLLLASETNLLFSMGWQFSFSVVLAILLFSGPLQQRLKRCHGVDPFIPKKLISPWQKAVHRAGEHLAQLISISVAAWIGALLPSAFYFHALSFSALGANVIAVPLAFVILLTGLLSLASGLIAPSLAVVFNNANWLFTKLLLLIVHGFALLPLSFSVALPTTLYPRLTLFDFSSAQAALLQAGGKTWAIDAGRAINVTKTMIPFLETSGIHRLEGLILTAKESAFAGGASLLVASFSPKSIMAAPGEDASFLFRRFVTACATDHQEIVSLHAGEQIDFSKECWAEVLYPSYDIVGQQASMLALKLHLEKTTYLMLPDSTVAEWLLTHLAPEMLHADILSLPWKDHNILRKERLLLVVAPKVLILPDSSLGQHLLLHEEEKQLLQRLHITLLSQEETGALIIDVLPKETKLTGFLNHQVFFKTL